MEGNKRIENGSYIGFFFVLFFLFVTETLNKNCLLSFLPNLC